MAERHSNLGPAAGSINVAPCRPCLPANQLGWSAGCDPACPAGTGARPWVARCTGPVLPSWYVGARQHAAEAPQLLPPLPMAPDAELKAGNFGAVRSLLRVLPYGQESKATLDSVIDSCRWLSPLNDLACNFFSRFSSAAPLAFRPCQRMRLSLLEVRTVKSVREASCSSVSILILSSACVQCCRIAYVVFDCALST